MSTPETSQPEEVLLTTAEMLALYEVRYFLAPFVFVTRKSDGVKGSLMFDHHPRYYGMFKEDVK